MRRAWPTLCSAPCLGPTSATMKQGYRFAQLGLDLVERHGLDRFKARVYLASAAGRGMSEQAGRGCEELSTRRSRSATSTTRSFIRHHLVTHLLACGDPLAEVQREAEAGLDFARRARVDLAVDRLAGQLQLIRTLRGLTTEVWLLR